HNVIVHLADRLTINKDIATRDTLTQPDLAARKLNYLAIFDDDDILLRNSYFDREGSVTPQLAQFTVDGQEVFGLHHIEQKLLFFLTGVTGDMHRCERVVDHICTSPQQTIN